MLRVSIAVVALAAACSRAPTAPEQGAWEPSPRDYEADARAMYQYVPDYEARWPIELHVRIVEGLTQDLERALRDLGLGLGERLFAREVAFGWGAPGAPAPLAAGAERASWRLGTVETLAAGEVSARLVAHVRGFEYLERASLKVKQADLPADGRFATVCAFELAGPDAAGLRRDHGRVRVTFARTPAGWRIERFELESMATDRRGERGFADVSEDWLEPAAHERLRLRSESDDLVRWMRARMAGHLPVPAAAAGKYWADDLHPGLAVVDLDADGWDDLVTWDVRGPVAVLHNQPAPGGRIFVESARRFGLELADVSALAFADLDNDGVLDVVVGRWFTASELWFGVRPGVGGAELSFAPSEVGRWAQGPALVASVALADVNRDGLLDVFFATAARAEETRRRALRGETAVGGRWFDAPGPPNVLLLNRGGGAFEDVTARLGLALERNTLQAAFADYDGDGLPDLFVANDFAPANLYRNEGSVFRDVSAETGAHRILWGMGASWEDFDNDGDLDLYASAMDSSAGKRILGRPENFAPELDAGDRELRHLAAMGNTLLRNLGGGSFDDATAEPAFAPARLGQWAYGAQLLDVNGDGWLDVYSPNGFFTLPDMPPDAFVRDT